MLGGVQRVVRVVFDVSLGERNRSPVHLLSNSFMCSCCPFCDLFATCNIIYKTRFDLFRNYKIQQIRAARGATRRTTKTANYKISEIPEIFGCDLFFLVDNPEIPEIPKFRPRSGSKFRKFRKFRPKFRQFREIQAEIWVVDQKKRTLCSL